MKGMQRPAASVLPATSMIPSRNRIDPPPNQFTHQVAKDQPFYYDLSSAPDVPNGVFLAGTKVLLVTYDGGSMCHVVDGRGLYVVTPHDGLCGLDAPHSSLQHLPHPPGG